MYIYKYEKIITFKCSYVKRGERKRRQTMQKLISKTKPAS